MWAGQRSFGVAFLFVVSLFMTTRGAAETPKALVAEADEACAHFAKAVISKTEGLHPEQMPDWKFKCEHHPYRAPCQDTAETIQMARHINPLKCVGASQPPNQKRLDPIAEADDACARYAGVYISRTEGSDVLVKELLPTWKLKCEHHPYKPTCEDTVDTIQTVRHINPLKCVGTAQAH